MTDRNIEGFEPLTEEQEKQITGGGSQSGGAGLDCTQIWDKIRALQMELHQLQAGGHHHLRMKLEEELSTLEVTYEIHCRPERSLG